MRAISLVTARRRRVGSVSCNALVTRNPEHLNKILLKNTHLNCSKYSVVSFVGKDQSTKPRRENTKSNESKMLIMMFAF